MSALPVAAAVLAVISPGWSNTLLIYPPYEAVRRNHPPFEELLEMGWRIVYYEEGITGTVAVFDGGGSRTLCIEGKPDASTWSPGPLGEWIERGRSPTKRGTDMQTMVLTAHVPMFCAHNRQDVLVVGLASGVTVGSVEQHPDVRSIVCAEISSEVITACSYFSHANHNALADPRLTVVLEDGRNHLLMNPGRYDLIISEPSNPWMPGSAKLFTREAFEAARDALKEDGVMCSWVETYSMQPHVMRSLVRSFTDTFPYVTMFVIAGDDCCMIGSFQPLQIDEAAWAERMAIPTVRLDLERVAVTHWTQLAKRGLATTESLRLALREDVPNTDDNSRVEFLSPLALTDYTAFGNWAWIVECDVDLDEFFSPSVSQETTEEFREHFRERTERLKSALVQPQ
jgi:spermidine synthase